MKHNYTFSRILNSIAGKLILATFALVLLFCQNSFSQGVLAQYTFSGTATCATGTAYTLPTVTPAVSSWCTFSEFTRGAGLTCNTATAGVFASSGWSTTIALSVSGNDYHEFGLASVAAGRVVTLTSISITHYRSTQTNISYELRFSLDGFTTALIPTVPPSTSTTNGPGATTHIFNLSNSFANRVTASGVVTFRLYTFASAAGTTWTNDNVTINGVVTPTAQPGPTITICSPLTTATMAAVDVSGANSYPSGTGTGTWTFLSGPGPIPTITTPTSPTSTITGL